MRPRQACFYNDSNGTELVLCGLCWTAVVALGTPPAADTWSPLNLEQGERFRESQSAEGRYRLLVEGITDYAIYLLDLDGLVTSWNRGAQRFKGYSESEIIGQHFSRFYTEEDKAIASSDRAADCAGRGSVRAGGLAGTEGRHSLLGARGHRPDPRL
jgi:PAS domain-containing protein